MIVQIYEIQSPPEAEKCIELGVDHLGSVLLNGGQWRVPSIKEVIRLSRGAGVRNTLIPLFQDPDTIFRALDYYRPHYVHFCESLTDAFGRLIPLDPFVQLQDQLKTRFSQIRIIRSIPIPRPGASARPPFLEIARELEPFSDIFLTDTWLGKGPVEGYIGITGMTVDWELAKSLVRRSKIPVILAGGLSPENAYRAVMKVLPSGADSCTLTNAVDPGGGPVRFKKDFRKVGAFVSQVREAEKRLRTWRLQLEKKLRDLRAELRGHSFAPHQTMAIEAIEEEISEKEQALENLKYT